MTIRAGRTARPANDLAATRRFYEDLVGLPMQFAFEDHDGFDGVIFGVPDERFQLEIVRAPDANVLPRPSVEDQLVLYYEDQPARDEVIARLAAAGFSALAADDDTLNPYWAKVGAVVVVDPDGYRLVLTTG
ncbi:MAG: VOC family protein [Thermoleophilaceae bacterium]|nr:VOC family protein [Thermoleophilaceae bacterium]